MDVYIYRAASGISHATRTGTTTLCGRPVFTDEDATDALNSPLCDDCAKVAGVPPILTRAS